ncbi:MAG: 3-dehydroquinate synthase II [Promethearchaeota archaeon]
MKRIILNFEHEINKFNELVQEAFNKDFLNFLVSNETVKYFENIERINIYSRFPEISTDHIIFDSKEDLEKLGKKYSEEKSIGFYEIIESKENEILVKELSKNKKVDFIIVSAPDWKIIPFENLIAMTQSTDIELIANVDNIEEVELMLKTLEIGVDGILITPKDVNDLAELKKIMQPAIRVGLNKAKVINIQKLPESDRVCVDTTSLLYKGEGMLVGSTAQGFALVHAEVFETQFVASRPFRVNAGDVSAYILVPGDDPFNFRTKYLSELEGGDKVLIVNVDGIGRIASVGRVKIETRPMLRFKLETVINNERIHLSCICQNAETIRLVDSNGNAKSVVDIKLGDEILVHLGPGATHFGTKIKETIIEK